ncbi:efflux RND transporter permease subunit [Methylophilus sp. UBA6697]|jgi:multidrug efflux pump|uniref:efflux RND transporter permease subunit n=1 Tax=Methylophilus sp. UBA6697 TaxID=1946902 RepID=UPI000EDCD1DF|nr:efflux RND transporter permease subunit [Methylophilus sp. UBA6697]HCU84901.1 multidrug transporter subunit MdtC [Methylophilus sp.]
MNPSRLFIERPVATLLLMLGVLLSGLMAYRLLPQSALPQVDYPTIQVVTMYPGASPDVMATAVTAPLERQFGSMTGLSQMFSSSSAGSSVITLQFALHLSLDEAEQYVQASINAAANYLPTDLPAPPVFSKVNPADTAVLTLAVSDESLALPDLQDVVETRLVQKISQVSGVGLVSVGGGNRPAVRIRAYPQALAAYGISFETLRTAIAAANSNQAKGNIDGTYLSIALDANSQLKKASEYRTQIVAIRNGTPVRLGDVAEVTDDVENRYLGAWVNQKPVILLSIQRQPGANVIEVVDRIQALLPELKATIASNIQIEVISDRTTSIRNAIHDVQLELMLAIALVIMVIFLFLKTLAGTLIPSLAVPLSLLGTFSVMYFAGFSVNNLTLMALTIATGFVVDDAIVMIENISRHIEEGASPMQAALQGSREIGFTIISLTFSLIAVLIPLLFMQDIVGRLFREFASTLAIAILISGIVSLTLTPMLSARLLKRADARNTAAWQRWLEQRFTALTNGYARSLRWVLAHQALALAVTLVTLLLTFWLVWWVPKGFFPIQDNGLIQAAIEAPQSWSFRQVSEKHHAIVEQLLQDDDVDSISSVVGVDGINKTLNEGRLLIKLKSLEQRKTRIQQVIDRLQQRVPEDQGFTLRMQPVQDLTVETRTGPTSYQLTAVSLDATALQQALPTLVHALQQLPSLKEVTSSEKSAGLKLYVEVNRDAASRLGISMSAIDDVLYSAYGQRFVSTIFTQTNQYRVVLEAHASTDVGIQSLAQLYVTNAAGEAVPLSTIAQFSERVGDLLIHRQDQFPAAVVYFNVAEGVSLGEAVSAIEAATAKLELPSTVQLGFQGAANAFRAALDNELLLVVAALITMYIVLGVLYESFVHPLTILSTLPSASVGALLALSVSGQSLTIIAIIGIVLLIGIVQKNAIMMIDFALDAERAHGSPPSHAIYQASLLRFRPILMTTLAALLSALPLMFSHGTGAELRQPLGIVMVGGLLFSQVLTLYTTPVIYLTFDRLADRFRHRHVHIAQSVTTALEKP